MQRYTRIAESNSVSTSADILVDIEKVNPQTQIYHLVKNGKNQTMLFRQQDLKASLWKQKKLFHLSRTSSGCKRNINRYVNQQINYKKVCFVIWTTIKTILWMALLNDFRLEFGPVYDIFTLDLYYLESRKTSQIIHYVKHRNFTVFFKRTFKSILFKKCWW